MVPGLMRRLDASAHTRPVLVFVAIALFFCGPVLTDPVNRTLGDARTDTWNHLWGYHHVAHALAGGRSIIDAPLLAWPDGGTLWFIDSFGAFLLAPVTLLAGAGLAMNLYIFLNLVLAGWGAWLLARDVTRSATAALFAGMAFESTPHLLAQVYNGITETVAVGWLPLFCLALNRLESAPSRARGVAVGLLAAACAAANAYYGLFAIGIGACWLVAFAVRTPRRCVQALRPLALGALAAGLAIAPVVVLFRSSLDATDAIVGRDANFVWFSLIGHNVTDVVSFFRPGDHYSPDLKEKYDDDLIVVIYVGWALLAATALGALRDPHRARPWVGAAVVAFVLALGPLLYVGGSYVRLGEAWVPLPFLALYDIVPGLGRVSHAFRLAVLVGLFLSVAGAVGVAMLRPRWAPALGTLVVLEAALASPAVFPIPSSSLEIPAIYREIDEAAGGILDLPVTVQVLARSRFTWYQAAHGKGVPWGLNDPMPRPLRQNRFAAFLIGLEQSSADTLSYDLPLLDLELGRRALRDMGYTAIVVHRELYPGAKAAPVLALLDASCGAGVERGTQVLYTLR